MRVIRSPAALASRVGMPWASCTLLVVTLTAPPTAAM